MDEIWCNACVLMVTFSSPLLSSPPLPSIIPHRHVPYLGMLTIIMNDYPQVKFAVLGILGVYVLLTRE